MRNPFTKHVHRRYGSLGSFYQTPPFLNQSKFSPTTPDSHATPPLLSLSLSHSSVTPRHSRAPLASSATLRRTRSPRGVPNHTSLGGSHTITAIHAGFATLHHTLAMSGPFLASPSLLATSSTPPPPSLSLYVVLGFHAQLFFLCLLRLVSLSQLLTP